MVNPLPAIELFVCERRTMRLSRPSCARLWESAQRNRPEVWEGRHSCLTCPVGAAHAGKTVAPNADVAEAYRMVCPRCFRRADRLIKGDLCVSCYNRQREVRIGRDRKGARPGLTDRLHTVQVRVRRGKKSELVRFDGVTGLPEVMLRVVKADPASVSRTLLVLRASSLVPTSASRS